MKEELNDLLIEIEESFDNVNGEFGTKNNYCLFCKSKIYNGKVGIVHSKNYTIF